MGAARQRLGFGRVLIGLAVSEPESHRRFRARTRSGAPPVSGSKLSGRPPAQCGDSGDSRAQACTIFSLARHACSQASSACRPDTTEALISRPRGARGEVNVPTKYSSCAGRNTVYICSRRKYAADRFRHEVAGRFFLFQAVVVQHEQVARCTTWSNWSQSAVDAAKDAEYLIDLFSSLREISWPLTLSTVNFLH